MRLTFKADRHPAFGPTYPFAFSSDREGAPQEGATVRFGWDDSGLYVFVELVDSSLIALNREDEQLHFETGDVFELFIKPLNDTYYLEMYAIPSGNKTTLFFPRDRSGMELDDFLRGHNFHGLEVSVEETSTGWNAQLFVPATQLTALGATWGAGAEWTVFCGRYNYASEELVDPELSMTPPLSKTNYHLTDEYALLKLVDA